MVNAALSTLTPMISSDAMIEFEPESEEDEASVQAESAVCNRIVIEENDGFIQIQTAIKDALLSRNGCMKAWVETTSDHQKIEIPQGEEPDVIAVLLEPRSSNETRALNKDGTVVIITTTRHVFRSSAVPIERMRWQAGFIGRIQDMRFIAEQHEYTRSQLIEMDVDAETVAKLQVKGIRATAQGQAPAASAQPMLNAASGRDTRDQDIIEVFECYLLADCDGDGISERYRVLYADQSICLMAEIWERIPYCLGSAFVQGHTITGESLFDHLKATQDVKTALVRQYIDNVQINNNGRYIYDPSRVQEGDILNPKAGGGIRARDPQNSVVPLMVNDMTQGILGALAYQDKVRTERGGAALDLVGPQMQLAGQAMDAVDRQLASQEQFVSMMARNLSETMVRQLFVLMHYLLRTYSNEPIAVRQAGAYVQVDPKTWPERKRVNVKAGTSMGERRRIQGILGQHVQFLLGVMQMTGQGVLSDLNTLYRTQVDFLRMGGVSNPERLLIDPASEASQQAMGQASQAAQQERGEAMALEKEKVNIDKAKVVGDQAKAADELEFDYYKANLDAQVEQGKIAASGVIDLEKARINDKGKFSERQTS
jgi:hypothetical protein